MDKECLIYNRLISDDVINQVYGKSINFIINYMTKYNLKTMVLGLSGGLDSTVAASICHEVSKRSGIKLIGRSLPILNKKQENNIATKCSIFCGDFNVIELNDIYNSFLKLLENSNEKNETPNINVANGNIQARLRMIYLYHVAQVNDGIVIDTDNLSEHFTGFFTIHGDVGILSPFSQLWKTEVYSLAEFLMKRHASNMEYDMASALKHAIEITPTDGLGISSSDCEQLGVKNYQELDKILIQYLNGISVDDIKKDEIFVGREKCVDKIIQRHIGSQFKRNKLPIDAEIGLERNY